MPRLEHETYHAAAKTLLPCFCTVLCVVFIGVKALLWFASLYFAGVAGIDVVRNVKQRISHKAASKKTHIEPTDNTCEMLLDNHPTTLKVAVTSKFRSDKAIATVSGGLLSRRALFAKHQNLGTKNVVFHVEREVAQVDGTAGSSAISMLKVKPVDVTVGSSSASIKYIQYVAPAAGDDIGEVNKQHSVTTHLKQAYYRPVKAASDAFKFATDGLSGFLQRKSPRNTGDLHIPFDLLEHSMLCFSKTADGEIHTSIRPTDVTELQNSFETSVLFSKETSLAYFALQDKFGDVYLLGNDEEGIERRHSSGEMPATSAHNAGLRLQPHNVGSAVTVGNAGLGAMKPEAVLDRFETSGDDILRQTARSVHVAELESGNELCILYKPNGHLAAVVRKAPTYTKERLYKDGKLAMYSVMAIVCAFNSICLY